MCLPPYGRQTYCLLVTWAAAPPMKNLSNRKKTVNISYVQYAIIKEKTTNKPKPGAAAMTLIYTLQKFRKDVPTLTKVCGHPSGKKNSAHRS